MPAKLGPRVAASPDMARRNRRQVRRAVSARDEVLALAASREMAAAVPVRSRAARRRSAA